MKYSFLLEGCTKDNLAGALKAVTGVAGATTSIEHEGDRFIAITDSSEPVDTLAQHLNDRLAPLGIVAGHGVPIEGAPGDALRVPPSR